MLVLCSALVGCAGSTRSVNGFIAPEVIAECPTLQTLPEHDLTMPDVEKLWAKDRYDYVACASSKSELVNTLIERGVINGEE